MPADQPVDDPAGFSLGSPAARRLVVFFHGYNGGPKDLDHVVAAAREAYTITTAGPGLKPDTYVPPLSLQGFTHPLDIVKEQAEVIAGLDARRPGRYAEIVLVGYSIGSLLTRKLYVYAMGEQPGSPFEDELWDGVPYRWPVRSQVWAAKVARIVLLAGVNKGWQVGHHMSLWQSLWRVPLVWLAAVLAWLGAVATMLRLRRGSPFVSQLRLNWLALVANPAVRTPLTVQLLGSVDDEVDPDDAIDLATGADFVYLDVPRTGHRSVVDMRPNCRAGWTRRDRFKKALAAPPGRLRRMSLPPADVTVKPDASVEQVVFVMHGIRDLGHWTHKVARRVMKLWQPTASRRGRVPTKCASVTATYGYFPMLPFLLPGGRLRKVDWFLDRYVEARAAYPNAAFHFVGHSNGTYLLARALTLTPACRFERVVFVGSVARTDLGWAEFSRRRQVGGVLNFVATADAVVATFPNAMELVRVQDLGGAGHRGFTALSTADQLVVRGGHSAGVREKHWDVIARFVADGVRPPHTQPWYHSRRSIWVRALGWCSPLVWAAIALVLLVMVSAVIWCGLAAGSVAAAFVLGAVLVLVVLLVLWVLTAL